MDWIQPLQHTRSFPLKHVIISLKCEPCMTTERVSWLGFTYWHWCLHNATGSLFAYFALHWLAEWYLSQVARCSVKRRRSSLQFYHFLYYTCEESELSIKSPISLFSSSSSNHSKIPFLSTLSIRLLQFTIPLTTSRIPWNVSSISMVSFLHDKHIIQY